ncbi:MAG: molybdenum cofactor guanylyltransferase [Nitrospirota bacterium]
MITGVILAGGKNKRIGRNKALLYIGNKRIIERILDVFETVFDDIVIILSQFSTDIDIFKGYGKRIVFDIFTEKGPLGGIYTGLYYSKTKNIFAVGCDMPFLNKDVIIYLMNVISDYDTVVPYINDRLQPLHAVYSQDSLLYIKKLIERSDLSIHHLLSQLRTRIVKEDELIPVDSDLLSFFNINREEDRIKAENLLIER